MKRHVAALITGVLALALGSPIPAQIHTDGTVGQATSLSGPDYVIPNTLGLQVGSNLFHSFSNFNINAGESATFTTDFAGVTTNVISRVTGGNPSSINGLLRSEIPGADFWFINPNGVTFGAGAALDVPGSFQVSTADFLMLGDCATGPTTCGRFDATNPAGSTLAVAPPSAFGFLDESVGHIRAVGLVNDRVELAVPVGKTISLVGSLGAVAADGTISDGLINASLEASEGRVDLLSVGAVTGGGPALVTADIQSAAPALSGFDALGPVALTDTDVLVNGTSGGRVYLRGSTVVLDGARINANTSGAGDAGHVDIDASDFRMITTSPGDVEGSSILTESNADKATGAAGTTVVRAREIEIRDGGSIEATTRDGPGGSVTLYGENITISEGVVGAGTAGSGQGGVVVVAGYQSTDDNPTPANVLVVTGNDGDNTNDVPTGDPPNQLAPRNNGSIRVDSGNPGPTGLPGVIRVFAQSMTVDGNGYLLALNKDGSDGQNGRGLIDLQVGDLLLSGGIATQTFGSGPGGDIRIRGLGPGLVAATSVTMPGVDETGYISFIQSGSNSKDLLLGDRRGGRPGDISIFATTIEMGATAQVTNGVDEFGLASSSGFSIDIGADSLSMRNGAFISSSTSGDASAGSVTLDVVALTLAGSGTRIEATTRGQGAAGNVTVRGRTIVIDAGLVTTTTFGSGRGGSIVVETNRLDVLNGGRIDTSSRPELARLFPISVFDGLEYDISRDADLTYFSSSGLGPMRAGEVQEVSFGGGLVSQPSLFVTAFDVLEGQNPLPIDLIARSNIETGDNGSKLPKSSLGPSVRGVVDAGDPIHLEVSGFPDFPRYPYYEFFGDHTVAGDYAIAVQLQPIELIPSAGDAGTITVRGPAGGAPAAQLVTVTGPGSGLFSISDSDRAFAGAAGDVAVAANQLEVSGQGEISVSTITGPGGEIDLDVLDLQISGGGVISAASADTGVAGSVIARGARSISMNQGRIDATAPESAAGNVELYVSDSVFLTDSVISGSSRDGGGNFIVQAPRTMVLQNSQILANSAAPGSGNISITADGRVIDPGSSVQATGEVFTIGTVLGNVVQLDDPEVVDAASKLETRCTPQQIENRSSLTVRKTRSGAVQSPYQPYGPEHAVALPLACSGSGGFR